MRLSTLFGRTLREAPSEAENIGYQLLLRAGLVRQTLAGSFALLPLGMRVLRRIEAIMHEELANIGAQEFRTPVVQSSGPWEQTGRYEAYGPLMLRLTDRSERALIVAPTHEEAVADLAKREITSYRQMPATLYQIHTKYRDELRAKGGLMRMREFTMLDAYSLDANAQGLDQSYNQIAVAFERIFQRCGIRFVAVEASAGEMGGGEPREYMAISQAGEDTLVICSACGYAANVEVAVADHATNDHQQLMNDERRTTSDNEQSAAQNQQKGQLDSTAAVDSRWSSVEEVATPHASTIADLAAFLGISTAATAKAVFFDTPERGLVFAVIRGDLEVNEVKLRSAAGVSTLTPASAEQIAAVGAVAGYASPVGLNILVVKDTERTAAFSEALSSVFVIADRSVVGAGPLVAGANREGYHLRNVVYWRDWEATVVADIATARAGDRCTRCGSPLQFERGVEIGHIFKLGTRYTQALGAMFLDADGTAKPVVMGSYGIGLERMLQIIVEQHHDQAGIIWPESISPFDVHLVRLGKGEAVRAEAEALAAELQSHGLRVLHDDRDDSAGIKFNDADLIGLPLRVLVSERLFAAGQVEIKSRTGEASKVARSEVVLLVTEQLSAKHL